MWAARGGGGPLTLEAAPANPEQGEPQPLEVMAFEEYKGSVSLSAFCGGRVILLLPYPFRTLMDSFTFTEVCFLFNSITCLF